MRAATAPHGCARAQWEALGTQVVLQVARATGLRAATEAVGRELARIDLACSRFRPDSELSRLNGSHGRAQRVGGLLAEVIDLSLRAAELTAGALDPTIGHGLLRAGYDRDWSAIAATASTGRSLEPQPAATASRRGLTVGIHRVAAWRAVNLDKSTSTVRIPRGTRLDLGALAKAWVADRAADVASEASGGAALVAVGGDLAVSGAPRGGWLVRVTDDHRDRSPTEGQMIKLSTGGLATSSTAVRRWRLRDEEMHHIIDPQTGRPARSPWRTVSVAAASCVDANTAALAALIKAGVAPGWLRERRLPARLVDQGGDVLALAGWPQERREQ